MSAEDRVFLAAAGRWTTRAGFGCSGLMGALSRRESLALLSAAWDAGVRHFDVAPLYGHGEAERVLGSFLAGRRDEATIVTKFGLEPTGNSKFLEIARAVARPLLRKVSAHRPPVAANTITGNTSSASVREPFDPREAERSLMRSLRALQTDRIDVLLLHEPEIALLPDDAILTFLENSVRKGLIGAFGIGGASGKAWNMFQRRPRYCPVVQCDWSPFEDEAPHYPGSDLIVFGVLAHARSHRGGASRIGPEVILRATALALPNSVILFSSRKAAHVISSTRALTDSTLDSAAGHLLASAGKSRIPLSESPVPAAPDSVHAPKA